MRACWAATFLVLVQPSPASCATWRGTSVVPRVSLSLHCRFLSRKLCPILCATSRVHSNISIGRREGDAWATNYSAGNQRLMRPKPYTGWSAKKTPSKKRRDLIGVPPKIERALHAFAKAHPEVAHAIEKSLKFRQAVLQIFEHLVCDGVPVSDSPEADERESEPLTEQIAFAPVGRSKPESPIYDGLPRNCAASKTAVRERVSLQTAAFSSHSRRRKARI